MRGLNDSDWRYRVKAVSNGERISPALDAERLIETIGKLQMRIGERFPTAGLGAVCGELLVVARESSARAQSIAKRPVLLRLALTLLSVGGAGLLLWVVSQIDVSFSEREGLYTVFQGIEAVANLVVLTGGTLLFMLTIEQRVKRRRALSALHELRVIMHVIDMHQLTKDPSAAVSVGGNTPSSPARTLTPYELSRYLDYCAEMMSLTSKVAVLFAQSLPDPVVTDAVSDIERIASGMAQKVWQKIMMLDAMILHSPTALQPKAIRPAAPAGGVASQDVEAT
jgi:hypothetical protein